ncbi:MAG: helix-turn-helix transcriptional regulator [Magnetococcus sp. DMHC-1]|nr:helix-turn-helix transcriptional regulator [Magnetococcales bacterium]
MSHILNITIDGVDYVAIPKTDIGNNPLDEEAFDVARYDHIKKQLATGEEELIPSEFVDRILNGESPLRAWREFRGLTLQVLADRVGVSKEYLFEIENGQKDGSVSVMKQIAKALKVNLDDIV